VNDAYIGLTLSNLELAIEDFEVVEEGPSTLGGEDAYLIGYTGTEPTTGLTLSWMQLIAIYEGQAYVITYTGQRDFLTFIDTAGAIFDSWEWR
jgi:hypothetical protein